MPASLLEFIADPSNLWEAWVDVRRNAAGERHHSRAIDAFQAAATERIAELHEQLLSGEYQPKPFHRFYIAKDDGGTRKLSVSSVRDRVVERAVVEQCGAFTDRGVDAAAHAYRPGRGVFTATADIVEYRDSGLDWCARMDIDDCFDHIPRECALKVFLSLLPDNSLDELLHKLVVRPVAGEALSDVGIPQGCALSPLLLNLALRDFDRKMQERGYALVRYSDDMAVFGHTKSEMLNAITYATQLLGRQGMPLNSEDSEIMHFESGFTFLGEEFGPKHPSTAEVNEYEEAPTKTLYVAKQGSYVHTDKGRIRISDGKRHELLSVPKTHVGAIVCFGSIGVSAGVRSHALYTGLPITFLSRRGSFMGRLQSASSAANVERLQLQIAASADEEFRLALAREFLSSKLSHQLTLLRRHSSVANARAVKDSIKEIVEARQQLTDASSIETLMGLEGIAARNYFHAYGQLFPEPLRFDGRSRRPPRDVVNAALGYGYAVLASEATAAAAAAGLEPACGIMHASSNARRRPSLALDLMEEFRPYVVDSAVLQLAKWGSLTPDHGRPDSDRPGGILLTKKGKQVLLKEYERRMLQVRSGALDNFKGSTRRTLYRQAECVMRAIEEHDPAHFTGFTWR